MHYLILSFASDLSFSLITWYFSWFASVMVCSYQISSDQLWCSVLIRSEQISSVLISSYQISFYWFSSDQFVHISPWMSIYTWLNVDDWCGFKIPDISWNPCIRVISANMNTFHQKLSFTISLSPELITLQH